MSIPSRTTARQLPVPAVEEQVYQSPRVESLGADAPTPTQLFTFMRDAERRFQTLRMRIVDTTYGAAGASTEITELWLRHEGHAKVVTRRGEAAGVARDFHVWTGDGRTVKTYDAGANTASIRPVRARVRGATDADLPSFARIYTPLTPLPMETLAEVFVHPHGYCRNVLATGRLELLGASRLAGGRDAFVLRCDHPRTSHVLTDRPDHWLEVGVDRMLGVILMLAEGVGRRVTRHAEVRDLSLDERIGDETFELYLSPDVRMIY